MAAAHSVGLPADWPSTQGSALPRSTLGFILSSAPRTEICVETNARQVALLLPPIFYVSPPKSETFSVSRRCRRPSRFSRPNSFPNRS